MTYDIFRKYCISSIAEKKGVYYSSHDVIAAISCCPEPKIITNSKRDSWNATLAEVLPSDTVVGAALQKASITRKSSVKKIQALARGR